jgi:dipeptidase E
LRFLLTSSGVTNPSIEHALVDLLGKPIADSSALCIATGMYPFRGGPMGAYRFIGGEASPRLTGLGWKSLGILELTALPSVEAENWMADVHDSDAVLVWGGDVFYLARWMRESGLAGFMPSLAGLVYVGVSAGAMATAPTFGETYDDPTQPFVMGDGLGLVDFAVLPHMDAADHPESTAAMVDSMSRALPVPIYGIDDETGIKVVDGTVEVISEGHWKLFTH